MADNLRTVMQHTLTRWREDLAPSWQAFFADCEPDFAAIDPALQFDSAHPVIPARKATPLADAPPGAHVFRAFDGVDPAGVRVIVIGQDPYPRIERATGRAFEDGALTDWRGSVAQSLQHLMQSALALRLGREELARGPGGWSVIAQELTNSQIAIEPLGAYFDRLQASGVLFVNAGWTLTRFVRGGGPEQRAHIALWRPLMTRLLTGLSARAEGSLVFLLLGNFAQDLFAASGAQAVAVAHGKWGSAVRMVAHAHPSALAYFASNPLAEVNAALDAMGEAPLTW
ncbi:hypothetical protein BH10PSE14_BH10PSE14_30770 [soil metagenome]